MMKKSGEGEEKTVFADLTGEVFSERGPNGLLDLAFHPKFRENGKYYLFYQVLVDGKVATYIDEKEFAANFSGDSGKPPRRADVDAFDVLGARGRALVTTRDQGLLVSESRDTTLRTILLSAWGTPTLIALFNLVMANQPGSPWARTRAL